MVKRRNLALFSFALLAIVLSALLYSGALRRPLSRTPKIYVSRGYLITFVWENELKELHVLHAKTRVEESDPELQAIASKEAAEVVPQVVTWSRLKRAEGQFYLGLQGYEEPYLIEWSNPSITKPDLERFMSAAQLWDFEWMKEQVASGTDVNARTQGDGRTALMWAASNPDKAMAEFLLAAGADPNERDAKGRTTLMLATAPTAKLLLAAGADVNARDDYRRTALVYAIWHKKTAMVEFLIGAGADVNIADILDITPLMHASGHGRAEMVMLLLAAGVDVNAKNKEGHTALSFARGTKTLTPRRRAVIGLLKKAGAKD